MKVEIEVKFDEVTKTATFLQEMGIFQDITFRGVAGKPTCYVKAEVSEVNLKAKLLNGLTPLIPGLIRNHITVDGDA